MVEELGDGGCGKFRNQKGKLENSEGIHCDFFFCFQKNTPVEMQIFEESHSS